MATVSNFGIPNGGGGGRGGFIHPKTKQKFRVRVFNFGPVAGGLELTQQVETVDRPGVTFDSNEVHSYNSLAYYAGKAKWDSINLVIRDDISNSVNKLVGHQLQKQMNFFQQTSAAAGSNYKFQTFIETLDGGNDTVYEQWTLEGCFLESAKYDQFDYKSSDHMTIQLSIRYDNATQSDGLMDLNPQLGVGPMQM
jgi:hypothetical protein